METQQGQKVTGASKTGKHQEDTSNSSKKVKRKIKVDKIKQVLCFYGHNVQNGLQNCPIATTWLVEVQARAPSSCGNICIESI